MNDIQITQTETMLEELRREFPELKKIFKKAVNGEFINENSLKSGESNLYRLIVNNANLVKQYFMVIGYELYIDKGFCYFLNTIDNIKDEKINPQDRKEINALVSCMAAFAFFKNINNNFGVIKDFEFTISNIENEMINNPLTQTVIQKSDKNVSYRKYIETQLKHLKNNGYIEEVSSKEGKYKTLNSLFYLVDRINSLEILSENENEGDKNENN